MFSGIIEASVSILKVRSLDEAKIITLNRPPHFDDIHPGDSIAVNGVCLTLESFDTSTMTFTLGFETLKVLGTGFETWLQKPLNVERSLAFGSRVHGHFVTGHVEKMLPIIKSASLGDNWILAVELTPDLKEFCWKKGSVSLNGVSLTINSLDCLEATDRMSLEVCLIPETQKRTNLVHYKVGELIGFEPDSFAKAISHVLAQRSGHV